MSSPSPGPSIEDDSSRRRPRRPGSAPDQGERGRASASAPADAEAADGNKDKVKIQSSSKRSRSAHIASAARREALELERMARETMEEEELEESMEGTRDAAVFLGTESDARDPVGPLRIDLEPLHLNMESSVLEALPPSEVAEAPLSIDIDKIKPRDRSERKRSGKRRPTTDDLIHEAVMAADPSHSELETFQDEEDSDDLLGTKITEDSGPAGLLPAGRPDPLNTGISGRRGSGRSSRRRGSSRRRATRAPGTGRALSLPRDQKEPRSKRDLFLYIAILALALLTFLLIAFGSE